MQDHEDAIDLFWTGGWDSTFRLLQATLIEHRKVQPIYIISTERRSLHIELKTIQKISVKLRKRLSDNLVLPIEFISRIDIPQIDQLRQNYNTYQKDMKIGSQYIWMAEYCQYYKRNAVEVCLNRYEGLDDSEGKKLILTHLKGEGNDCRIESHDPRLLLYQDYRFPTIHISKREMGEIAKDHDFEDLLGLSWYCHRPVLEKACGVCEPCKIRKGLIPETRFHPITWYKKAEYFFKRK